MYISQLPHAGHISGRYYFNRCNHCCIIRWKAEIM